MKLYIEPNVKSFSNCYVVVNETTRESVIIDPGEVSENLISLLEENQYKLIAVLITHNHKSHTEGLKTLCEIYNPQIYAADWQVAGNNTNVLTGDGKMRIGESKTLIFYTTIPGHSSDSLVFRIENLMFTGDVIFAGCIGSTNSTYSKFILKSNIEKKIFSQQDSVILLPGHGPPTSLAAARQFNVDFREEEADY